MTAAKVMDIISRLPGCDGQAADAVSAFTQVKNGGCSQIVKNSQSKNVQILDTSTEAQVAKIFSSVEDSVVPLERNLYGYALAGLLWERQFEKVLLEHGWEKVSNWECLFVNRARGLSLSVYVNDIKLARKTENIAPTWKIFMKDFDLGEPTSFLDHVYLACTQRECQISQDIVANYRDMFECRISAGAKEKLPIRSSGKPDAETVSSWSYAMENHAKKCVERYCELAKKRLNNYTKSQCHAWMTINSQKKQMSQ